jgi:hypothetical protein
MKKKINRMFGLSDWMHPGRITKIIDLKTKDSDYLITTDDKKAMWIWSLNDAKLTHIDTFTKGFGQIVDIIEFRRETSHFYSWIALAFEDKRIAILELKFKQSKKDANRVKVSPEFKSWVNVVNVPKGLVEVGKDMLVIVSNEFLYYYHQKDGKCLQPTSPTIYQFQSFCPVSDTDWENIITVEGAKIMKYWDHERSYDKHIQTKASDKIIWITKIPGRRAIIIWGNGGIMRFLVAYKDNYKY